MKKFTLTCGLSLALLSSPIWMPATACAQDTAWASSPNIWALAPADAYFGRFRMSILGIRNTIKDVSLRIDRASADDLAVLYDKLSIVDAAIRDLKDQYPQDSWLPQLGLSIAEAFARMPFAAAQIYANQNLDWVIAQYPASDQAFYADGIRRARLVRITGQTRHAPITTMDVPIEPVPSSYAVPSTP